MKAVVQVALGEAPDVLEVVDIEERDQPAAGNISVKVALAPVHHGDLQVIRSQPDVPEDGYVRRGSEAVGYVSALGSNVAAHSNLKVGDRVIGFPANGSWAESVEVPGFAAIPVPSDVSDEVAAQLLINSITALTILRDLRRSVPDAALRERVVLVTGASTVVGRLLLHLLGQDGGTPIGLARSTASAERVADEITGARVIATDAGDWQAQVTSCAAGKEIVGVLDCVSGTLIGDLAPLLADGAVIIAYGALGGQQLGIGVTDIVVRQFVIRGVTFGRWFVELSREEQASDIEAAFRLAREVPAVFKVSGAYSLQAFGEAIAAVEAPNRDGFVFIKP